MWIGVKLIAMILAVMLVGTEVNAVKKSSKLGKEYVTRGTVEKFPVAKIWNWCFAWYLRKRQRLYVNKVTTVAVLRVDENSAIDRHEHKGDNEIYLRITWRGLKLINICTDGLEHGYPNDTDKKVFILAIKWV